MTSPAPVCPCPHGQSYPTLRAVWEAVQNDPKLTGRVPFRCSECRTWHVRKDER